MTHPGMSWSEIADLESLDVGDFVSLNDEVRVIIAVDDSRREEDTIMGDVITLDDGTQCFRDELLPA